MKILITIFFILISVSSSFAAYLIYCNGGVTAINQTGKETIMVNGDAQNYTFTVNDYDSFLKSTNCVINEVPNNSVFSGNALIN